MNALTTVGGVRAGEGDATGIAELEESAALAEKLNSPELPRTLNNLAGNYGAWGRVRDSDATMAAACRAADRFGMRAIGLFARANQLFHLYRAGDWDGALAEADAVIDEAVGAGLHSVEKIALIPRMLIELGRGNVGEAEADSVRMLEIGRVQDDPQALIPALASRVIVLAETGRSEEAQPIAEELRALQAAAGLPFPGGTEFVPAARCIGVDAWLAVVGDRRAWRTPWLDAIDELLRGDPERAIDLYAAFETPGDVAFARLEAAKASVAAGRAADARAHLEGALEFYRRVGATRYIAEAEALLAPARAESG